MFEKEFARRKQWIESLNTKESPVFESDTVKRFISSSLWKLFLNHQKTITNTKITPNSYILLFKSRQKNFFKYMYELMDSVVCHPFIYLTALYYVDKLSLIDNQFLNTEKQLKLYFGVCVLISSKMHEDSAFENKAFYEMLKLKKEGYNLLEFSRTEFKILEQFNYELWINFEDLISVIKSYELKLQIQMKVIDKHFGTFQKLIIFEQIK
jgi:hypothetical protein